MIVRFYNLNRCAKSEPDSDKVELSEIFFDAYRKLEAGISVPATCRSRWLQRRRMCASTHEVSDCIDFEGGSIADETTTIPGAVKSDALCRPRRTALHRGRRTRTCMEVFPEKWGYDVNPHELGDGFADYEVLGFVDSKAAAQYVQCMIRPLNANEADLSQCNYLPCNQHLNESCEKPTRGFRVHSNIRSLRVVVFAVGRGSM